MHLKKTTMLKLPLPSQVQPNGAARFRPQCWAAMGHHPESPVVNTLNPVHSFVLFDLSHMPTLPNSSYCQSPHFCSAGLINSLSASQPASTLLRYVNRFPCPGSPRPLSFPCDTTRRHQSPIWPYYSMSLHPWPEFWLFH